jgi:hypothetical protein
VILFIVLCFSLSSGNKQWESCLHKCTLSLLYSGIGEFKNILTLLYRTIKIICNRVIHGFESVCRDLNYTATSYSQTRCKLPECKGKIHTYCANKCKVLLSIKKNKIVSCHIVLRSNKQ